MSVVEHPNSWIPEYEISLIGVDKRIPNPRDFSINICCVNCRHFDTFANFDLRDEDGLCLKNVANDEYGEYIKDSDTFYCSYHKFKV